MPSRTIAAVTIGQTPRPDVVPEIVPLLGPGVHVIEVGALDDLGPEQIVEMRPAIDDDTLVTRLRDGQEVLVGRSHILLRVQACIDRVQDQADLIIMLCTGTFPPFVTKRLVLYPEQLLFHTAQAIARTLRVGVLTPSAQQIRDQERRWSEVASAVTVRAFSPYVARDDLEGACAAFRAANVDVVVLDCLGYTVALKQDVGHRVGRPVLLARSVLARVAAELVL